MFKCCKKKSEREEETTEEKGQLKEATMKVFVESPTATQDIEVSEGLTLAEFKKICSEAVLPGHSEDDVIISFTKE